MNDSSKNRFAAKRKQICHNLTAHSRQETLRCSKTQTHCKRLRENQTAPTNTTIRCRTCWLPTRRSSAAHPPTTAPPRRLPPSWWFETCIPARCGVGIEYDAEFHGMRGWQHLSSARVVGKHRARPPHTARNVRHTSSHNQSWRGTSATQRRRAHT
jgi:hypothetical protein